MSTNGTESRQVSFRLDGTSHYRSYYQQNQPFPFPDALQEFSIQTSNYSAAQGNSAGAVVNAVTRSGTNNFHGGAFGYLRDREFTARNYFTPDKDFLKRKQYGGFAGGPIRAEQDVLLRRLAGHDHRQPGHEPRAVRADEPTNATATSPRCGAACNRAAHRSADRASRSPAIRSRCRGSIRPRSTS